MRRLALHWQILIGLGAGLVVGVAINLAAPALAPTLQGTVLGAFAEQLVALNDLVGGLFLRGLKLIAAPIVLLSLVVGAASLDDLARLSRIGGRTMVIYVATTAVAITTGLVLANALQPGSYVDPALRERLAAAGVAAAAAKIDGAAPPSVWDTVLAIVPTNPFQAMADGEMLQIVAFALMLGVALTRLPAATRQPVLDVANGLNEAVLVIVDGLMRLAPIAVFSLMASAMARLGLDVLGALLVYALAVILGLAVMMFGIYPVLLKALGGVSVRRFYAAIAPAQLLAFSSSSSSATLPVTMECVEERLGVRGDVASFVLPLGATINMDGTALYQGVAALFIAQLYGVPLDLGAQLTIVLTATLASIGTAGVPGVGLVMLIIVLQAVNMPIEAMEGGIAILLGVDRLLDMCRTTCNVTGDCMVCAVVASREGALSTPDAAA